MNNYSPIFPMTKRRFVTEIRQDQIVEAALDIVRTGGTRRLSVAAVAAKVGIVPSAVYRHFRNKGDIVTSVLRLIRSRLDAHFKAVERLEIDAVDMLHRLFNRHIALIAGNSAIPRIVFSEEVLGGMPEKQEELYDIIRDVLGRVESIVSHGQAEGSIRGDISARDIAVAFFGMIQPAAVIWHISGGEFDLMRHSRSAWRLFSDSLQIRCGP
ncbi:MAG: TetR/AcrR family transcriptional regulator [Desulfococcus multivorans]|nr:TetR/AcrR family transcriptional regulator [Desulfococcus multivorans]